MQRYNNGTLNRTHLEAEVALAGWVANKRVFGDLVFVDLRDRWGITQIICQKKQLSGVTKEAVIEVQGVVQLRKEANKKLATGEIEVVANKVELLAPSAVVPFVIRDQVVIKEENRLTYRYLDLRSAKMQRNLILRHRVIKTLRDFFNAQDFLEIETPYLSKSTPEGARDFLVPTRHQKRFFALPQSPQIYKQLLMAAGFNKYFQIARCFRDEDARSDRQPEFTQLDLELSFTSPKAVQKLIEKMFETLFKTLELGKLGQFQHLTYAAALDNYGTDKPDLRYQYCLQEVTTTFVQSSFKTFQTAPNVKMLLIPDLISQKQFKKLENIARKFGAKGLMFGTFDQTKGRFEGPAFKLIASEIKPLIAKATHGTILLIADQYHVTTRALGAIRVTLNAWFKYAKNAFRFVWIDEWPLFEYSTEAERYVAMHHPFTDPIETDKANFEENLATAQAKAYDLVLNGFEIGGGSMRINNLELQKRVFGALGIARATYETQFGFFLEAFKYGLPPHGGIAFGLDRLIMILANATTIRDVIAFPKNSKGFDMMSASPSLVSQAQLKEYNLQLLAKTEGEDEKGD